MSVVLNASKMSRMIETERKRDWPCFENLNSTGTKKVRIEPTLRNRN